MPASQRYTFLEQESLTCSMYRRLIEASGVELAGC